MDFIIINSFNSIYIGILGGTKPALFGGNWNNSANCGAFYANLNNTASNTNTNNGAALTCKNNLLFCLFSVHYLLIIYALLNPAFIPYPLVKISPMRKVLLVASRTWYRVKTRNFLYWIIFNIQGEFIIIKSMRNFCD